MHRTLRALATAAAAVVLGATLAGPAQAGDDPALTGAPTVGTCFDMTLKQANARSYAGDPVDCSGTHTAQVFTVATLPDRLDWSSSDKAIGKAVVAACDPDVAALIGSNRLELYRSQYQYFVFLPTQAQQDAGARWFDCTISVLEDTRLAGLSTRVTKLSKTLPDKIARCVTTKYAFTTCADTHAWRSSHAFYATGKATTKNVDAAANRVCPRHVSSRKWLRSAWDVPGTKFIVGCYSKTSR